jgi:hypothetical protein
MQTYTLDLETLVSLLEELGQNGRLSCEMPSGVPGLREACQARIDLQDGKIIFCQIEGRGRRVLASGNQALRLLSNLGPREWQLVETQPEETQPLLATGPLQSNSRNAMNVRTPSVIPQRVTAIDQQTLNRLPRRHRWVLNLVDGMRSVAKIASLLSSSPDMQTIQQVGEILQELEALGMITIKA